jgi:hypothetical protein
VEEEDDGKTKAERIAETAVRLAMAGDIRVIKFVFDRIDGRAPQPIEFQNNADQSAEVTFDDLLDALQREFSDDEGIFHRICDAIRKYLRQIEGSAPPPERRPATGPCRLETGAAK